jgi:D-inositol-3-phosphate glycosyltransferase
MFLRSRRSRLPTAAIKSPSQPPKTDGAQGSELRTAAAARLQLPTRAGLVWATEGLMPPTGPFRGGGARLATAEWAGALARYGRIPCVDIFAPITCLDQCREQFHGMPARAYGDEMSVARFFPESDLPTCFLAHSYDILHTPADINLTQLSYIRSRLSRRVFPVTCSQTAISYSFQLDLRFVGLLTAQNYPCDAIVCPTQSSRWAMEKRLRDIAESYNRAWDRTMLPLPRLELIPWGVDTHLFTPRNQDTARRDLELPPDRPILLCLGHLRIEDKMDWMPLLLAFEHVTRRTKQKPILVLAGPTFSEYGEQLIACAGQMGFRDSVRTLFNLPGTCLPSLYAACDVFVSPSDSPSESFGLTIVEAMACGRPVVASDWDGYKELIVHGETGFKVRTDWADCLGELNELAPALAWEQEHLHVGQSVSVDVAQMAGYLIQLVENRELREEMGRRGRARVEAYYDWGVVIAQWEALWRELGAIARSVEREERDRLDYLRPNYFAHFSHYASRIIDDTVPVRLTPRGRDVLAGTAALFLSPRAQGFLHLECLRETLSAIELTGPPRIIPTVGDMVQILRETLGLSRDSVLMHLMWLAKYDLARLGEGTVALNEPCEHGGETTAV